MTSEGQAWRQSRDLDKVNYNHYTSDKSLQTLTWGQDMTSEGHVWRQFQWHTKVKVELIT